MTLNHESLIAPTQAGEGEGFVPMTLDYESLIAAAQAGEGDGLVPMTLRANLIQEGEEESGDVAAPNNNFPAMPGEVCILEVKMKYGLKNAPILKSFWNLNGTMIDLTTARQSPISSKVPTKSGPMKRDGGEGGIGPGRLMVAWVGLPGVYPITVTGTCLADGNSKPFILEGNIILLPAPVTAGDAEIVGEVEAYPYDVPNTSIRQEIGFDVAQAPKVGFQWKLHTGENLIGTSGFVQMIRSREYLRYAGATVQRMGPPIKDENILDSDGKNIFFPNALGGKPDADVKISDGPFLGMERYTFYDKQPWEFFGYKCRETKRTYLAYQALKGPASIASFVVGASYQDWSWFGQAVRKSTDVPFNGSGQGSLSKVTNRIEWLPLEWNSYIGSKKYQEWVNQ